MSDISLSMFYEVFSCTQYSDTQEIFDKYGAERGGAENAILYKDFQIFFTSWTYMKVILF